MVTEVAITILAPLYHTPEQARLQASLAYHTHYCFHLSHLQAMFLVVCFASKKEVGENRIQKGEESQKNELEFSSIARK